MQMFGMSIKLSPWLKLLNTAGFSLSDGYSLMTRRIQVSYNYLLLILREGQIS